MPRESYEPTPLSELLVRLRKERGLSTWGLAQASGIDRSNIRRIESGQISNIAEATMQRLAEALDVEVEEFYEAHWETTKQPLPSLPTYFRSKYEHLSDEQIAAVENLVDHFAEKDGEDRSTRR